jgi:hypothetical protein
MARLWPSSRRKEPLADPPPAAEPFSDEFKAHTSAIASGPCSYGLIPEEHWGDGDSMPEGIDVEKANEAIAEMG